VVEGGEEEEENRDKVSYFLEKGTWKKETRRTPRVEAQAPQHTNEVVERSVDGMAFRLALLGNREGKERGTGEKRLAAFVPFALVPTRAAISHPYDLFELLRRHANERQRKTRLEKERTINLPTNTS
jgi:hypothetical protein